LCPTSLDLGAMGSGVVDILCQYWVGGVGKATCSAINMWASVNVCTAIIICVRVSGNKCASVNMRASRWGA